MGRQPCCDKAGLKKGPWTIQEDHKLVSFIINNGIHCWRSVPKLAGLLRCGKSCRLRWINYLRPDLKRGALSQAEEDQIIQLHARLGNRWSKIASHFPGRTDNEIKNIWNTKIRKRLKLVGLDPKTHQPIDENEKELEEIKNDIIEGKSGETIERDHEFNTIETIETGLKTGGDIKYDSIPFSDSTNTQSGSQAIDLTEFLEEYEMLLFNDETTQSPSFSQNPSIAESSSNTSSKEDLTQQWVESVDSILSWDYFDIFESEFFLFG